MFQQGVKERFAALGLRNINGSFVEGNALAIAPRTLLFSGALGFKWLMAGAMLIIIHHSVLFKKAIKKFVASPSWKAVLRYKYLYFQTQGKGQLKSCIHRLIRLKSSTFQNYIMFSSSVTASNSQTPPNASSHYDAPGRDCFFQPSCTYEPIYVTAPSHTTDPSRHFTPSPAPNYTLASNFDFNNSPLQSYLREPAQISHPNYTYQQTFTPPLPSPSYQPPANFQPYFNYSPKVKCESISSCSRSPTPDSDYTFKLEVGTLDSGLSGESLPLQLLGDELAVFAAKLEGKLGRRNKRSSSGIRRKREGAERRNVYDSQ